MKEKHFNDYGVTVQVGDWFYSGNNPRYKIVGIGEVEKEKTELMVRNLDGTHSVMIAESILYSVCRRDDSDLNLREKGPDDEISNLDIEDIESANARSVEQHHRNRLREMQGSSG